MNHYKAIKVQGKKHDEHRFLVEQSIGRKLSFNEVVHHKDGDKRNNSLSNLQILDRSEHAKLHMKGSSPKQETREKLRISSRASRPAGKLSNSDVLEIRKQLADGMRISMIAKSYDVNRTAIIRLKNGRTYGWLT